MSHIPRLDPPSNGDDIYLGSIKGSIVGGRKNNNQISVHNHGVIRSAFEQLQKYVAPNALHDSGEVSDQLKCHPGTRVAILEFLESWASASEYEHPILWLHGPAGAGKSAILRTISQILQDKGVLLASFFFFRSDPERNSSERVLTTIAFQLALAIPAARLHIIQAIEKNPLIFTKSLWDQVQTLIISPILLVQQALLSNSGSYPRVIVVDGLDECRDPGRQCDILRALCRIVVKLPIPFCILVASRPEHHIRGVFDLGNLNKYSTRIGLDNSYNPDADIESYLRGTFEVIRQHHPLNSCIPDTEWPSPNVVLKLVAKASGQFIYASTVDKFVSSPRHNPVKRLDIILGAADAGNLKPFEQLDVLYSTIFSTIDEDDLHTALRILGALQVPYTNSETSMLFSSRLPTLENFRSPAHLERLLNLERGEVRHALFDLESLLTIAKNNENIRFFHASLSDYLFDRSRSGRFWVDAESVYADLAEHHILHLFDWQDLHPIFMNSCETFFSSARPTFELQSAVQNCDLEGLVRTFGNPYPYGLNYLVPTLLAGAIGKSRFPNATGLFRAQLLNYERLLEPVILIYFNSVRLKYLLVAMTHAWVMHSDVEAFDEDKVFRLHPEELELECTAGFDFASSKEPPPAVAFIRRLLHDPQRNCFIDENQFADITLHGLKNLQKSSSWSDDDIIYIASRILRALLPICAIRDDLIQQAKNMLSKTKAQGVREPLEAYIVVCFSISNANLDPYSRAALIEGGDLLGKSIWNGLSESAKQSLVFDSI